MVLVWFAGLDAEVCTPSALGLPLVYTKTQCEQIFNLRTCILSILAR